jgi:carbon monoxide dehydrogenase subunit G
VKLEQSFEVAAPVERVWNALIDVEQVAPCLPGAAVTGRNDDGSYSGTFTVKIGPTTAAYAGKLEMASIDEAAHTATMQANGTDKRGQGGAKATILSTVSPANGGTRVEVTTDYHITGRLARFGRGGMIEDISARLLREFAHRLQESLAAQDQGEAIDRPPGAPEPSQPVRGVSLMSSVLVDRVRRNPAPVAFVAALLLGVLLVRRARRC